MTDDLERRRRALESSIAHANEEPEYARRLIGYAAMLMKNNQPIPEPVAEWLGDRLMRVVKKEPADRALGLKRKHGGRSGKYHTPDLDLRLNMMAAYRVAHGVSDSAASIACADFLEMEESGMHKHRRNNKDQYERLVEYYTDGSLQLWLFLPRELWPDSRAEEWEKERESFS